MSLSLKCPDKCEYYSKRTISITSNGKLHESHEYCGNHGICKQAYEIGVADSSRAAAKPEPLTLEQLRGMDGKPVWVKEITEEFIDGDYYGIVCLNYVYLGWYWDNEVVISTPTNGRSAVGVDMFSNYGKTWLAYTAKPEEE